MSASNLVSLLSSSQQSLAALSAAQTSTAPTSATTSGGQGDFASSLALRLAEFESQSLAALLKTADDDDQAPSIFDLLAGNSDATAEDSTGSDISSLLATLSSGGSTESASGLSASGLNLSLADPLSAFRMMSYINTGEVNYKAQFAELSQMGDAIESLESASDALGAIDTQADNAAIAAQLQSFVADYNAWITRFDGTVKSNGVLAGTQAAEVSLVELEFSIKNNLNGATSGLHGLSDLGLTIDDSSNLATLDSGMLDAALASNKSGVVATIKQFASNFSKSADLLNSPDNFIDNRLDNLDRVIDYLADNKSSLQTEFGTGAAAQPTSQVASALATYNQIYAG